MKKTLTTQLEKFLVFSKVKTVYLIMMMLLGNVHPMHLA